MKNIIITTLLVIISTITIAQPPQRQLPNQFRDYVDFKQEQQRPQIERKDGKVIITMTEQQFRRMRMMRQRQHMVRARFQQPNMCTRCAMANRRPPHQVKNFRN